MVACGEPMVFHGWAWAGGKVKIRLLELMRIWAKH